MTSEKLIQITRKRLTQFIVGLVLFLLCLFSVFGKIQIASALIVTFPLAFLMHRMCGEMIATALHNQMAAPSYAAASTLPPVITYIGENKKIVVEPPIIEPTPPPFKPTYRVHYDSDEGKGFLRDLVWTWNWQVSLTQQSLKSWQFHVVK